MENLSLDKTSLSDDWVSVVVDVYFKLQGPIKNLASYFIEILTPNTAFKMSFQKTRPFQGTGF